MKRTGQSLSEYALLGAIVALVAIPVMATMGVSLSGQMGSMLSNKPQANAALVPNGVPLPGGCPAPVLKSAPISEGDSPAEFTQREKDLLDLFESASGGGTQTASVSGVTETTTNKMLALSETWKDSKGQPIDTTVKHLLQDLANAGKDLAKEQSRIVESKKEFKSPTSLFSPTEQFAGRYLSTINQINVMARRYPEYQALAERVNQSAGVITKTNYEFARTATEVKPVESQILKYTLVGEIPSEISVNADHVPVLTLSEAKNIAETAKEFGHTPKY